MTEFEKTLIKRLYIINNTEVYPNTTKFSAEGICDVVVDTLLDLKIPFFENKDEVTEYVFPKELRKGDTFYWVMDDGTIDEFTLSKVVYRKDENGDDFTFEVFILDNEDEYSVGWISYDAYGDYIFTDIEEAKKCAKRYRAY